MDFGLHHHAKLRKQARNKPTGLKFIFDRLAYTAGILMALMTAPQIWKIYSTHDAAGVSFYTWFLYGLGSIFWVAYGLVHKEKPIVFTNIVAATLQLVVAFGAIFYS